MSLLPSGLLPWLTLAAAVGPLGGCVAGTVVPVGALGGLEIAAFHRSIPDLAYSAVTGRDCSVVRLDRGESYCRPIAPPVPPQPYCTRSLGTVDCWADGAAMANQAPQVAQGPVKLTAEQEWWRTAPWPANLRHPPEGLK